MLWKHAGILAVLLGLMFVAVAIPVGAMSLEAAADQCITLGADKSENSAWSIDAPSPVLARAGDRTGTYYPARVAATHSGTTSSDPLNSYTACNICSSSPIVIAFAGGEFPSELSGSPNPTYNGAEGYVPNLDLYRAQCNEQAAGQPTTDPAGFGAAMAILQSASAGAGVIGLAAVIVPIKGHAIMRTPKARQALPARTVPSNPLTWQPAPLPTTGAGEALFPPVGGPGVQPLGGGGAFTATPMMPAPPDPPLGPDARTQSGEPFTLNNPRCPTCGAPLLARIAANTGTWRWFCPADGFPYG